MLHVYTSTMQSRQTVESTEHSNTRKASDCLRHALDRPYLQRSPAFSFKLTRAQLSLSVQGK